MDEVSNPNFYIPCMPETDGALVPRPWCNPVRLSLLPRWNHSSFVKLVAPESEYFTDAVEHFKQLCEGQRLVANVDHKKGTLLHLRPIDPVNLDTANDPNACINVNLVAEGLASIDRKGCKGL